MIHDARVEVTCDGRGCTEHVYIPLEYGYVGTMHTTGRYDDDDSRVEVKLIDEHEWIVKDGKHFCSAICSRKAA